MDHLTVQFKKLSEDAIVPYQANYGDAGYDLCSTEEYVLKPGERKLFKTNITTAIPVGYYGRIAPRSGLAYKHGIDVLAGVIDCHYRGDIGVIIINFGENDFPVAKWDRIAQFIIEKCHHVDWQEVEELDMDTERGEGGFGASGVSSS